MAEIYTTAQGDTWDLISYKIYGTETYAGNIMAENFEMLDTIVFDAGTSLNVPVIDSASTADTFPDWR